MEPLQSTYLDDHVYFGVYMLIGSAACLIHALASYDRRRFCKNIKMNGCSVGDEQNAPVFTDCFSVVDPS